MRPARFKLKNGGEISFPPMGFYLARIHTDVLVCELGGSPDDTYKIEGTFEEAWEEQIDAMCGVLAYNSKTDMWYNPEINPGWEEFFNNALDTIEKTPEK